MKKANNIIPPEEIDQMIETAIANGTLKSIFKHGPPTSTEGRLPFEHPIPDGIGLQSQGLLTFAEKIANNKQKRVDAKTEELERVYAILQTGVTMMRRAADAGKSEFSKSVDVDLLREEDRVALLRRLHAEYPEEAAFINLTLKQDVCHDDRNEQYIVCTWAITFAF